MALQKEIIIPEPFRLMDPEQFAQNTYVVF